MCIREPLGTFDRPRGFHLHVGIAGNYHYDGVEHNTLNITLRNDNGSIINYIDIRVSELPRFAEMVRQAQEWIEQHRHKKLERWTEKNMNCGEREHDGST